MGDGGGGGGLGVKLSVPRAWLNKRLLRKLSFLRCL